MRLFNLTFLIRRLLIMFILLLPFQALPNTFFEQPDKSSNLLLKVISYSDEVITFIMFAVLFSFIALKPETYRLRIMKVPTTKPIIGFVVLGCFSIIWNKVYIAQGIFGLYDFLKNIIILYFFANLRWRREEMLSFITGIKIVIIMLAVVGIIGEILAVIGMEPGYITLQDESKKRLGMYRVTSFTGKYSANSLGMYALLGFFIIQATTKNFSKKIAGMLTTLGLIFLTFSRQTWLGLAVMMAFTKRILILLSVLLVSVVILMIFSEIDIILSPDIYYRGFTYIEALKVFLNNPLIGAGPGMFGGLASVIFDSPYYNNWPVVFKEKIFQIGSLDSFWPSVLAEVGVLGFLSYFFIWVALYRKIAEISKWFKSKDDMLLYKIGNVLKNYILALVIMCFFMGLNKPFVVYTFHALCGIYLSLFYQDKVMTGSKQYTLDLKK